MKKTTFCCDRCGEEIKDIVYTITVYGEVVPSATKLNYDDFAKKNEHNNRQNKALSDGTDRHLCRNHRKSEHDGRTEN